MRFYAAWGSNMRIYGLNPTGPICKRTQCSPGRVYNWWNIQYAGWWPGAHFTNDFSITIQIRWWRHNEHDGVSNHQPHDCLFNSLFGRRSKNTPKLRVTGLCEGNSPVTGEFPAHKGPVTGKMFPFDEVIMWWGILGTERRVYALLCCAVLSNNKFDLYLNPFFQDKFFDVRRQLKAQVWGGYMQTSIVNSCL